MPPSFRTSSACMIGVLLAALACASRTRVLVPPRVDLAAYGTIGIIDFHDRSADEHGHLATRQFVQMLQEAQPGAPILELGSRKQVLARVRRNELDFEAVQAIGEAYRVDALFVGDLVMSQVKPNLRFDGSLTSVKASANINGELDARLMETSAGATVWSRRATSSENVAHVGIPGDGAMPSFGATDPGDVESRLVGRLVSNLSPDFSSRWVTE